MKTNGKQSAYPLPPDTWTPEVVTTGLTKREYFASVALQGLTALGYNPDSMHKQLNADNIANKAVQLADALLLHPEVKEKNNNYE